MLGGLGGKLRSFRLGGTIGSCRPNPYGIVGSLESSLSVTICGSGMQSRKLRASLLYESLIVLSSSEYSGSCVVLD